MTIIRNNGLYEKSKIFLWLAVLSILLSAFYLSFPFRIASASENYVRMYYFYSRDCRECQEVKEGLISALTQRYGQLQIKYFEISDPKNYELQLKLEKRFRPLKNPPPTIFIGSNVLDGKTEIEDKLEPLIKDYILKGGCDWPAITGREGRPSDALIIERFKRLGALVIVSAGLLDGINPCAFTTIIFLISCSAFMGRKGRDIFLVGWAFTIAVFITYLLIGLGLFEFTKQLAFFPFLSRIFSLLIAAIAGVLGILSIYDYYKIRKGKLKEIVLQLPQGIKDKIHSAIREGSKTKRFILASLSLGFLVALLEFPCTGQVYLPIIFVLRHIQDLRIYAFSYLVLYNLMFILPLILVFIFAYKGISSKVFTELMQRNAGKVKILTAILFFATAAILIIY